MADGSYVLEHHCDHVSLRFERIYEGALPSDERPTATRNDGDPNAPFRPENMGRYGHSLTFQCLQCPKEQL